MILSSTKTGALIPVQSESEGHRAARNNGWTDYQIEPRNPATTIGE